jgi:hypothetical protein
MSQPGFAARWLPQSENKPVDFKLGHYRISCQPLPAASATIQSKEHQADVAQLVEQLIRNQQVSGSIPLVGSIHSNSYSPPEKVGCFA